MEILEKNYEFKYSLRSMFVGEEIRGKPFEVKTLLDTYIMAYACIIENQDNPSLEFNDFINYCDEHPEVIEEFNKFMSDEMKKRELLKKNVTKKKTQEKKKITGKSTPYWYCSVEYNLIMFLTG